MLGKRWVQYGLLVVAALLAFAWARQHYINQGKQQGHEEATQQAADYIEKARTADREVTAQVLKENAVELQRQRELGQAAQLAFMQLASTRQQAAASVAGMSASQVEDAIARALGKQPGANTNTEQDRRTIANCLQQLPYCEQQIRAREDEIKADEKQIATTKNSLTALGGYAVRLEEKYAELYNLKASPKRSIKCAWLWRCTRPSINVPNPEELLRTKPQ